MHILLWLSVYSLATGLPVLYTTTAYNTLAECEAKGAEYRSTNDIPDQRVEWVCE